MEDIRHDLFSKILTFYDVICRLAVAQLDQRCEVLWIRSSLQGCVWKPGWSTGPACCHWKYGNEPRSQERHHTSLYTLGLMSYQKVLKRTILQVFNLNCSYNFKLMCIASQRSLKQVFHQCPTAKKTSGVG